MLSFDKIVDSELLLYILDQINEAIHITDENGVLIYMNHSAEVLEDLDREKTVGQYQLDVYYYNDYKKGDIPPSFDVLKTGVPRLNENCEYFSQNGKGIHSILSNYPYAVTKSNQKFVISVSDNVSLLRERLIKYGGITEKKTNRIRKNLLKNGTSYAFEDIIGESQSIKNTIDMARRFAGKKMPVMIYGETGTGKEMFAQSIHNASPAVNGKFIPINCAAIPEGLLESILFGTVKGSFTGALDKPGLFEIAENGTIFLDEINSMPIGLQAKILRVLQEKEVQRIGDSTTRKINCRVLSATNKLPSDAIHCGELREDLFYRLSSAIIFVPPLRERTEDIPLLVDSFIQAYNQNFNTSITQSSELLKSLFKGYSWPGNVRELSHTVESAANMMQEGEDILSVQHLPAYIKKRIEEDIAFFDNGESYHFNTRSTAAEEGQLSNFQGTIKTMVDAYESSLVKQALGTCGGNVSKCSKTLGLTRQGLEKKLKKYNIEPNKYRANLIHK